MPEQFAPIFIRKRTTNRCLLLHKLVPNFVVIGDDIESWRQSEIVAVALEQTNAEGVNGAEECAVKCGQDFDRNACLQNFGARALR